MYLTFGGDIKLDSFEINSSCSSWFHTNVKIEENKRRTLFSNHVYHLYEGKKVIGYTVLTPVITTETNHLEHLEKMDRDWET